MLLELTDAVPFCAKRARTYYADGGLAVIGIESGKRGSLRREPALLAHMRCDRRPGKLHEK